MAATGSGAQRQRQKMISLMYLVFIAMLAIQIDQEIIRSYSDTNDTLTNSRLLTEYKNDKIFEATLLAKAKNSPESYQEYSNIYSELKQKTNSIVDFIQGLKSEMNKRSGYDGKKGVEDNYMALNSTEAPTHMFFENSNEADPSPQASELKSKVEDLRQFINAKLAVIPVMKNVTRRANANLVTEFPNKTRNGKNWLQYKFYGQPLIAALSNLEIIQSEVRNVQADALTMMLQEKVDADIKFNAFEAIVSAPDVVLQGEPATAKVIIGTYASNLPGLNISGVDKVENGQGFKFLSTGTVGDNIPFNGQISFNDANGKAIKLPFNHTYRVIAGAKEVALQSGALVSADKMNVLYRGLPNPVSGSILGADNSQVSLSASGASVSGGRGKWTVTPGTGATVTITISGKDPKGKAISQSFPFRVKNIPPPVGQIRGETVVTMPASSIPNQTVSVSMPDFDFPVSFSIQSFMFKVPGRAGMMVSGASLSSVAPLIRSLKNGDIAYVYNIQAVASGLGNQTLKKIPPVVINIQ